MVEPTVEWTDEEKASALALLGGVKQTTPTDTYTYLYGEKKDSGQQMLKVAPNEATAWAIVQRGANGVVYVGTPTLNAHATTKAYVDGLIAELQAQIDALKG